MRVILAIALLMLVGCKTLPGPEDDLILGPRTIPPAGEIDRDARERANSEDSS